MAKLSTAEIILVIHIPDHRLQDNAPAAFTVYSIFQHLVAAGTYFLFHMGNLFSYLWKDMLCSAGCTRFAKVIVLPSGGRESALL